MARGERRTSANQFGVNGDTVNTKSSPTDFASPDELTGWSSDGIYAMTDGVSDAEFESAATTAITTVVAARAVGLWPTPALNCGYATPDFPSNPPPPDSGGSQKIFLWTAPKKSARPGFGVRSSCSGYSKRLAMRSSVSFMFLVCWRMESAIFSTNSGVVV